MKSMGVLILWDESHLWGVLALHALLDMGLPCSLINSLQITQANILGKINHNRLLLAPGGSARLKAKALGAPGLAAIRRWVENGGAYLGICGGAGLALSQADPESSLGLCAWKRAAFANRADHLLSGHVNSRISNDKIIPLPIWWPGRFEAGQDKNIQILAKYESPTDDLWLADHSLSNQNAATGSHYSEADFPMGQPLIIYGRKGKGSWLLSYAHLETPGSLEANRLLGVYLKEFFDLDAAQGVAKSRNFFETPACPDASDPFSKDMLHIWRSMRELLQTGVSLNLFFQRTPWLFAWKQGVPGIICNHLLCQFHCLAHDPVTQKGRLYWQNQKATFLPLFEEFYLKAKNFMLKHAKNNGTMPNKAPNPEKQLIFGHPMLGGGLAGRLLTVTEKLFFAAHQTDIPGRIA